MENITMESLEGVLPGDPAQQNAILKRLVLTLRQKYNSVMSELSQAKAQLCTACARQEEGLNQAAHPDLAKKELAAAVAKVASIQADYDSLVAHFAQIQGKHQQILKELEGFRSENERLRARNAELTRQMQIQQVDLSRFSELQVMLTNCQLEKQRLEEEQARGYAVSVDQSQKLQQLQMQAQKTILDLQGKLQQQDLKLLQFDKTQAENIRLRSELQQVFQLTSCHSVVDLSKQIDQLREANSKLEVEADTLRQKNIEERTTATARLETEKKRIIEQERQLSEQQRSQLKTQFDQLMNQQQLQFQQQTQQLTQQIKALQIDLQRSQMEAETATKQCKQMEQQLQSEAAVFNSAKQKAKLRNQTLAQELDEVLMAKEEAESRVEQLQAELLARGREISELKAINRQFQRQSESVFLQLKDVQPQGDARAVNQPPREEIVQDSMIPHEIKSSVIGLTDSAMRQVDFVLENDEIQLNQSKNLTVQVVCKGGSHPDNCCILLSLPGENIQSGLFNVGNENDTVLNHTSVIPWTQEVKDELLRGIELRIFDQQGDELDMAGFKATDLVKYGTMNQQLVIHNVILDISLQVDSQ